MCQLLFILTPQAYSTLCEEVSNVAVSLKRLIHLQVALQGQVTRLRQELPSFEQP